MMDRVAKRNEKRALAHLTTLSVRELLSLSAQMEH